VIARLVPESAEAVKKMPDFRAGCALSSAQGAAVSGATDIRDRLY